ncbi:MAG: hypothetical protein H6510_05240 [Acidobacteria bacterium]|nr:hypothetical protein [Acidobacteriota bacterium]MCB9397199.1 hypothetical protein [Acidobacteriota bacterium]
MSTPRYDLYSAIHKGLRLLMMDTLVQLGRTDWQDPQQSESSLQLAEYLLQTCQAHLEHENAFIHNALNRLDPESCAKTTHDHRHHEQSIQMLGQHIQQVRSQALQSKAFLGSDLYRAFGLFVAENLEHMLWEETHNNAALWRLFSDAEIQAIEHNLVQSIAPVTMLPILRFMLPALNSQERQAMLEQLEQVLPEPVFAELSQSVGARKESLEWVQQWQTENLTPALT